MIHLSGNLVCIDCHDPEMARWQAEACERVSRYGVSVAPGERAGTRAIVPLDGTGIDLVNGNTFCTNP